MASTIPQNELRNQVSAVLRRAEQGERFIVTVNGRPTAELGPLAGARAPASGESLARIIERTPVDRGWKEELRKQRRADEAVTADPWRS
jgi:prevent-host-death family protein